MANLLEQEAERLKHTNPSQYHATIERNLKWVREKMALKPGGIDICEGLIAMSTDLPKEATGAQGRHKADPVRGGGGWRPQRFKEGLSTATKVTLSLFIFSVLIGAGFLIFGGDPGRLHSVLMYARSTGDSSAPEQESVADVVKRSKDAVVQIAISDSAGQETALGSGFLISADGEIITNYHVIKEAHSATVKLSNGASFPVSGALASDEDKDLAIVKVSGKDLPFLRLGEIENLHVGDHVVAIGSPLGLEGTASDGIVSALRNAAGMNWIQTTAPVSHGNSGGPLLDMGGHVVGVITWGINLGQNLNFAAPSSEVKTLLVTAHQKPTPLDSVASGNEGSFTGGTVWTSITSGSDFNVRHDGDYLYTDLLNIDVMAAGGFQRE